MVIRTQRLDLVPLTAEVLALSLAGDRSEVQRLLGATLPPEWPIYPDLFAMRLAKLKEDPALLPWLTRAMVLRETAEVIGVTGFHTAPGAEYLIPFSPGAVEFGYTVLPAWRRRGFARETALGLMNWATTEHGIRKFIMSIRPDNLPSQALAQQLGFVRIGSHQDEVDGEEDVLELRV